MTRNGSFTPLFRALPVARMSAAALIAMMASGCMEGTPFPTGRSAFSPATASLVAGQPGTTAETSAIIAELAGRVSVLPGSGPYAQVAEAVLRDAKGSAKAELRVARLTAQATSKNWLPRIGPSLSLTRLGDLAAELLISQTLWDNGAKRAEREAAAADVEVAAVSLSAEMNDTVAEGLRAYINALKAREQAAVADRSVAKLGDFNTIMQIRVEGGLSDGTEARVLAQKLSEMQATAQADRDAATAALAQLRAMTAVPLDGLAGMNALVLPEPLPGPLSVTKSRAEAERAEAEAQINRAGHLPKLGAEARTGSGNSDIGLTLGIDQMLGFGTKAQLEAVEATREAASARVARTEQAEAQELAALRAKIAALAAREARDGAVVAETAAGLEMFTEQYKMGRRSLMDLVSMYENHAQMAHAQAGLKYDIALIELEIARKHGILVDGSNI